MYSVCVCVNVCACVRPRDDEENHVAREVVLLASATPSGGASVSPAATPGAATCLAAFWRNVGNESSKLAGCAKEKQSRRPRFRANFLGSPGIPAQGVLGWLHRWFFSHAVGQIFSQTCELDLLDL